jgi:hypothetical protein
LQMVKSIIFILFNRSGFHSKRMRHDSEFDYRSTYPLPIIQLKL